MLRKKTQRDLRPRAHDPGMAVWIRLGKGLRDQIPYTEEFDILSPPWGTKKAAKRINNKFMLISRVENYAS